MRRYCREVDISDIGFIERCIWLWLAKKKKRADVQHFLAQYSDDLTYRDVREHIANKDYGFLDQIIHKIVEDIRHRIQSRELGLPPICFKQRYDTCCRKWRTIGVEKPIHQIFDYIVVEGCKSLLEAKIGPFQMASIPGRGQEKGCKQISKWLQMDAAGTRYYTKGDVKKCYPSIPHDKIKAKFARDIKNPELVWLVKELIDIFPEGLSIGSYFSQYACNYYLSDAYHYACEQLFKIRKRRGKETRVRLVSHVLFYMDDILVLGASKQDIEKAMNLLTAYVEEHLGLTIKPEWKVIEADYTGRDGKHHGRFIDMMGYRIYRDHITIRRTTFKRCRRSILRAGAKIKAGRPIAPSMARRVVSYNGRLTHSDSRDFEKKYDVPRIMAICNRIVSENDKEKRRKKNEECISCTGETGRNPVCEERRWAGGCVDETERDPAGMPF